MRKVMMILLFVAASAAYGDDIVLRGGTCQVGSWGTPDTGGRLSGVSVFMTKGVNKSADAYKVCRANTALVQKTGCFTQKKNITALKSGVKGVTVTFVRKAVAGGDDHYEIDGATEAQLRTIFTSRWSCP
jgi:hypothetical protein